MDSVKAELGDYRRLYVDVHGDAVGLALLWVKTVGIKFLSSSMHHMG